MKILSIKQPWAWLIVNGFKDIENRSWATNVRGKVLVHAGLKFDGNQRDEGFWEWDDIPRPQLLETGGIVGMTEIVDCVTKSDSRWFQGDYGFVLGRSRVLPFMPMKGKLGFFEGDYDSKLLDCPDCKPRCAACYGDPK